MSWLINSKIVADTILGYMEPNTAGQSERCGTRKDGEYDAARRGGGDGPYGPRNCWDGEQSTETANSMARLISTAQSRG